jgi:transposase-like protein
MSHRSYTDSFKEAALKRVSQIGWRPAASELGVDHKTLFRWAKAAGLDHHALGLQASEANRAAAAMRNSRVALERAEARERVVTRLLRTTEVALARELELLVAGGFTREDLQAITNSRMKAIQQFELLEGRFTERQDFGADAWLAGVNAAIHTGLEVLPAAMAQLARDAIANALREVQEKGPPALPVALDADEAEDGEYEVVGEVTA